MPKEKTAQNTSDIFPKTLWTQVRLAMAEGRTGAAQALNSLCKTYERPILTYILRSGHSFESAQDLKQAFFESILSKNALADAEDSRVKLRCFLITKLQSFLIDRHRYESAQKRGAGQVQRLADLSETHAARIEPVDPMTPLIAFQRQWMETLVVTAMTELKQDYTKRGQADLFATLAPFITAQRAEGLAALAAKLGRPEGTLKSDLSRMRARCQNLIREQIATTLDVPTPQNIDAELKELMGYRQ